MDEEVQAVDGVARCRAAERLHGPRGEPLAESADPVGEKAAGSAGAQRLRGVRDGLRQGLELASKGHVVFRCRAARAAY